VAKEASRRNSYVALLSGMWCLLRLIFPMWHLFGDFFQS